MENEKRLIDLDQAKRATYEEIFWTESEQAVVRHFLAKLPRVDAVEVVHGRWDDGDCTACGFDIRDLIDGESDFRNWVWEGLPYCPNCGAKMDGDGNA